MSTTQDRMLRAEVRHALAVGHVPTRHLGLRVRGRVVRLGGTVPTEPDRVRAIAAALSCPEVVGVASDLDLDHDARVTREAARGGGGGSRAAAVIACLPE